MFMQFIPYKTRDFWNILGLPLSDQLIIMNPSENG